jgi:hypothetical protein
MTSRGVPGIAAIAVLLLETTSAAQVPDPRAFHLLRDEESWAWLRNAPATGDPWDPVKYLRLGERQDLYLTLGGELREWGEGYRNEQWGSTHVLDNVYWLQRIMVHADAHLTPYARLFVQLKSGIEDGRIGGPRPVDEDRLDFNALYADTIPIPGATLDDAPKLLLRIGRQEMSYGSGRLIDVREGPNVRFGYDGARMIARAAPFRVDAFAVRPQVTQADVFGDGPNLHEAFWGTYATYDVPRLVVDAYYLGLQRDGARYQRIMGNELRHTLGARGRARLGAFEVEVEAAYQLGSVHDPLIGGPGPAGIELGEAGRLTIAAWTAATEAAWKGTSLPLRPAVTLGMGATSGDRGAPHDLGTFNPLFPRGAYFGLVSANGPSNNVAPHASVALTLPRGFSTSVEGWAFWRESGADGVYSVPGNLLRPGGSNQGRYLGSQVEGYLTWQADHHLSLNVTMAYFAVGTFFQTSLPGENIVYGATWATYKF